MEQIFQSAVLQALGWAIADSIWQMALLWLVFQLLVALPFRKPALRHLGATIALFTGGAWFIVNVIVKISKASSLNLYGSGSVHPTVNTWIQAVLPYLSTAYLIVLVLMLAKYAIAIAATQRLRTAETLPGSDWQPFVDELALRFFISRRVMVRITEMVNVPATIGFFKPVILLPVASVNNLSVEQVEAIIMHELAHIRRHDYLLNLLASFVETLLFFNPFAHLLGNQMRKECELCCDDAVLEKQQDPGQYAYALLLLERSKQQLPLVMAATGKESLLLGRVKRILNQPEQKVKYRHKLLALVLVALLIMGLSLIDMPSKKEDTIVAQNETATRTYKNNENISFKQLVIQHDVAADIKPPAPPAPKKPVSVATVDQHEAEHFHPDAPVPPPPPPPFGEDVLMPLASLPEPGQLVMINGLNEKELEEVMTHIAEGKMMMDMNRQLQELNNNEREFRRMNSERQRIVEGMHRLQENFNRQEKQIRIKRVAPEPVIIRGRKPVEGQHFTPEAAKEIEKDITLYRAIARANQKTPQVKTFVTEEGFTFSIVDEENSISIRFSNK